MNTERINELLKQHEENQEWLKTWEIFSNKDVQKKNNVIQEDKEVVAEINRLREEDKQTAAALEEEERIAADKKQSMICFDELKDLHGALKTLVDGTGGGILTTVQSLFREVDQEYLRRVKLLNG